MKLVKLSSKSEFSYYERRVIKSCSREKNRGIKNNPVIDEHWIEGKGVKVQHRWRKESWAGARRRGRRKVGRERERESEWWAEREEVGDPHGNRIKTLGKRNFSCGKGCWGSVRVRGFGWFGAFGNPPKKSRNGARRRGDFPRGSPRRRAMLLDPLARIALPAKVIGQLRGIIIRDMYHRAGRPTMSWLNVTARSWHDWLYGSWNCLPRITIAIGKWGSFGGARIPRRGIVGWLDQRLRFLNKIR